MQPLPQPRLTDERYFVVIVDHWYMTIYPIATKTAVPVYISDFILCAERFFHYRGGYRVVTLHSDNGVSICLPGSTIILLIVESLNKLLFRIIVVKMV